MTCLKWQCLERLHCEKKVMTSDFYQKLTQKSMVRIQRSECDRKTTSLCQWCFAENNCYQKLSDSVNSCKRGRRPLLKSEMSPEDCLLPSSPEMPLQRSQNFFFLLSLNEFFFFSRNMQPVRAYGRYPHAVFLVPFQKMYSTSTHSALWP